MPAGPTSVTSWGRRSRTLRRRSSSSSVSSSVRPTNGTLAAMPFRLDDRTPTARQILEAPSRPRSSTSSSGR